MLRPDRGDIWAVVAFSIVVGALLLATPVAVQTLVNFVAFGASGAPLLILSALLFLGLSSAALMSAMMAWIVEMLQRRVFVRLVADLSRRLPRVRATVSERHYAPELVNRFLEVMTVQKMSAVLLLEGLGNVLGIVVGLLVLAFYHPLLLAFDLVLMFTVALVVFGPMRKGVYTATKESKAKYAVVSFLQELARNPLTFRSGRVSRYIDERAEALARSYVDARRAHYRVLFTQIVAALGLQVIASTALLAIGGLLVISGELTLGQLVASELIVTVVVQSVAKMGKHIEGFYDLMAAVDKLGQLLDLELETSPQTPHAGPTPAGPAALRLRNVAFAAEPHRPLFAGVNLSLEPGQALAVRGSSGSGRSLFLAMLYGLRNPLRGEIAIAGNDYRELPAERLREMVAIASSIEIFEGTIFDNLTLGRKDITLEEVTSLLRSVGVLDSLRDLPEGLNTVLRSGGVPLTENQRRLLMVVRAALGKPRLLLIDGLLDMLSATTRTATLDMLFRPDRDGSLVIVTDREDVTARCDLVLDLDDHAPAAPVKTTIGVEP